ncbi:DUF4240 domain-containing protein [Streptomyces sp. NPDC020965]|uniref:DUF4240 domain-containing protein n=1 Tax=Streptomyces sp. NPDC020965 TaxID=3365105 RepID=UPI0037A86904
MDVNEFWRVIEGARSAGTEGRPFADALVDELTTRSKDDILGYAERFDEVHEAVYQWDMRGCRLPHRRRLLGRQFHGLPGRPDRPGP